MSPMEDLIFGFVLVGVVTGVIAGFALVLARKEAAEIRLQRAAQLFQPVVRKAS